MKNGSDSGISPSENGGAGRVAAEAGLGKRVHAQSEFSFTFESRPQLQADGLASWRGERDRAVRELATEMGLPIDQPVEVRLKDGVILRGKLRVGDVVLSLDTFNRGKVALEVGGLVFSYAEMESCVRLD